ncbi:hypothetical protein AXF42_Ash020580 [Apostasia shenzhenica]|uniref:Uncharacterized protein n=1 Tax=Apostasia shenzhenica TaxID=1088818 RepID=A0A2I0B5Y4_9ASPA|nr:hypothetical protein AXF42_Ash020580 [Apostasia shenzhenica]
MEVVVPMQEFHFQSARAAPYISAPTSPKRYGSDIFDFYDDFASEPTSPSAATAARGICAAAFRDIDGGYSSGSLSSVPFGWEEKPGTPKSHEAAVAVDAGSSDDDDFDFAFPFSKQVELGLPSPPTPLLTAADELFEEGKIRPLKPPPCLYKPVMGDQSSKPTRRIGLWSPRLRAYKDQDPFAAAIAEVTGNRGRPRSRKGSRSPSPFRFRGVGEGEGEGEGDANAPPMPCPKTHPFRSHRRWRLKDLLSFRSSVEAGDGKNSMSSTSSSSSLQSSKTNRGSSDEVSVASSFRSVESESLRQGSSSSLREEAEFSADQAMVDKKKKKVGDPPPFRHGLSSYLSFNPAVRSLATGAFRGFSFIRRQR